MTIQEMHIAVNLGVQKIASFQADNLLPQEIDHELNNAMNRLIKQRYAPMGNKYQKGFEQSQKRIDDLRNLVSRTKALCTYYGESVDNNAFFIERAELPQDYLFLVNLLTQIRYNCASPVDVDVVSFNFPYIRISLTPPAPGYVLTAVQHYDPANPTSIGGNLIAKESGMDYNYYSNPANYAYGAIPSDSEFNMLLEIAQYAEATPTVDSNVLLIRLPLNSYYQSLFENGWRALWKNPLTEEVLIVEYEGNISLQSAKLRNAITVDGVKKVPAKYVQHDDIHALLYDPFNTTTDKYPKYTIQENFVDIYSDNKFIPTFVELTYIRHPKQMNSIEGIGCELPEHTHQEIVEMAVQSILEAFENPRYQTQSREVLESE
jgi:hypothetical protein